jgi:hypothetical protein
VNRSDPSAPPGRGEPVVLHSSWTGIVGSGLGALLLVGLAALSASAAGFTIVTLALAIAGLGALAVVVFDMPVSSVFDDEGVTRRAVLRHQRIDWDDVTRLSRLRKGFFRGSKSAPTGGLIAQRGRRNVSLVDQMEGHVEYTRLRATLGEQGERLGIDRIAAPAIDQAPTWMHRRSKWRPDATPAESSGGTGADAAGTP